MFTRVVTDVTGVNPFQAQRGDYLFKAAVSVARKAGAVSVSNIMTALLVSRAEAIRFIDHMEELGLVGPANGCEPRPFRGEMVVQ